MPGRRSKGLMSSCRKLKRRWAKGPVMQRRELEKWAVPGLLSLRPLNHFSVVLSTRQFHAAKEAEEIGTLGIFHACLIVT